MAAHDFTINGTQPAYDTRPGGTVTLDARDPGVQANIANGILTPTGTMVAAPMTCPACLVDERKRPARFTTQEELDQHYSERHQGLVAPQFEEQKGSVI